MLSCKEVNRLCSEEHDRPLSLSEKINLRMHLAICRACTNFRQQMKFLRTATRRYREGQRGPADD
ncbi:MAG: zf-HC2 domain-containing protein [Rhodocyclaceae bacterium]|nr:zf-HC2 domain-containing protein [Rhodocyclaceae bacterium]